MRLRKKKKRRHENEEEEEQNPRPIVRMKQRSRVVRPPFERHNLKETEQTHAHGREAVPDLPDVIVAVGGQELMMSEEDGADARAKVEPQERLKSRARRSSRKSRATSMKSRGTFEDQRLYTA